MTVRGTTKKRSANKQRSYRSVPAEYVQAIIAIIFVFFSILVLIVDVDKTLGYYLSSFLSQAFGEYYLWIFSPVLLLTACFMFFGNKLVFNSYRFLGLLFFYISTTSLVGFFQKNYSAIFDISSYFLEYVGDMATFFVSFITFIISLIILFRFSPAKFTQTVATGIAHVATIRKKEQEEYRDEVIEDTPGKKTRKQKMTPSQGDSKLDKKKEEISKLLEQLKREKEKYNDEKNGKQLHIRDVPKKIKIEKKIPGKVKIPIEKKQGLELSSRKGDSISANKGTDEFGKWQLPSVELLDNKGGDIKYNEAEIKQKELEIQEKLLQFNVDVNMSGFKVGPTVIQYRLKPNAGVSLRKIVNLKSDLTLALHAKNIRIQAPIPGQGVVGIEVPNPDRQMVGMKEILKSKQFNDNKIKIPLAFGKNVNGDFVVGDLTKMPHMLVAGQTASGKSVGVNAFLLSMLYKFSPSELKLILIDPKIVELSVYNGIPHLLTPVITKPEKALNSLKWAVAEMLRRYDLERQVGARNIEEYNDKVDSSAKLPYIVIVLDELADLMMSGDKKEVEGNITRIAQMARAVGMHLIIATQRPSVNIITGVIKANVPSRVAFTVSSQIDSQTILGKKGAEDLLGMGDMLYFPTGVLEPERVQGVFVETHEVESVINHLKLTVDPDLLHNMQDDSIVNGKSKTEGSILENYQGDQEESPEIIEKAILVVKEAKKGSTSLVQRKLGLGYARAAKVLDILEELGVVGPANGSKPRDVYVD